MSTTARNVLHATTLAVLAALAAPARAIDTDPLDFVAPPPNVTAVGLYYGDWSSSSQYADSSTASRSTIHSRYGVVTAVRFFEVFGTVAGAKVVLPFSATSVSPESGSTASGSGFGDPTLVFPVWLLRRPESRTYLAVVPRIQVPIGAYHKGRVSPGQNRFTFALQPGFTTGLTEKLSLDLVADVQAFTDNRDIPGGGRLEQRPLFSVQSHLTYALTEGLGASIGAYEYVGGETRTRGASNHDRARTTTLIGGLDYWFTKSANLQFQYRTDVAVENGARFDGFQFRFLSVF